MTCDNVELVRAFWTAVGDAEFERAAAMMAPDATIDWPLSNERMDSPDKWREVNVNYPGRWKAEILDVLAAGDRVVTRTRLSSGGISDLAISWFTLADGRIAHLEEYWPENYAAPAWRAQWTTPIRDEVVE